VISSKVARQALPLGIHGQTWAAMASPSRSGSVATITREAWQMASLIRAHCSAARGSRGCSLLGAIVVMSTEGPSAMGGRLRRWPEVAMTSQEKPRLPAYFLTSLTLFGDSRISRSMSRYRHRGLSSSGRAVRCGPMTLSNS
jgi:hypothetical protein